MAVYARLPGWDRAVTALSELWETHRDETERRALGLSNAYAHRRAAMVVDVVASAQRNYQRRVLPMVARFEDTPAAASLDVLAVEGPGSNLGLRLREVETVRGVAAGLVTYCRRHELDTEVGVAAWAMEVAPFAHAHRLDPYVGITSGIGPALFAYLRMLSGADAIKPDLRVRQALIQAGLTIPKDVHAILAVAEAMATALKIPLLVFDQLLWWEG